MGELTPRVEEVWDGTYQINTYSEDIDLTFNQYLVHDESPALVHAGSAPRFDAVVEGVNRVCSVDDLDYVLVTHFESDECGALSRFLERNPAIDPVCSEITARQLRGFGLHPDPVVKAGGETLDLGSRTIEFLDYPAEMHLWNGVLAYDRTHRGLFSADLFRRRGPVDEQVIVEDLSLTEIPRDRIPDPKKREAMADRLADLSPRWVAPGHGPVIQVPRGESRVADGT